MTRGEYPVVDVNLNERRKTMTLGECRVATFTPGSQGQKRENPGGNEMVNKIKRAAADLIDLVELIPKPENDPETTSEIGRLKSLAMTHIENAAMWAVKAATKPSRE